ncbi:hypothetical protein PHYBLDRAFT_61913 [Phycomyces blakesleeanus NRRL 1555(-)]|uniref:Uncharacterized protein n=1 Tax=Phycomyces blakesleeanus (strain ATCC 8743b / DSM 1359 / FGSC 10004 / NBRC 33097 / NRRL 1555) TaxID=763407 RepID=A0A162Q813_PHYB8|nr:hypothetical protein PHYBLDRAFT_61913 [Phycomyces blakesleeanus NRRL 1555(-)]OAD80866.1 hypothetical protein PHYBLDRAFT_61913 [Phycomyces blakesleeanus NRRL 1555(-)]|eukprot:XP_018298906.1 hypothetical protein PHYBLDRAFT_61913 [Phycomyces blakesleeanus NRRL 1555(-)]
MHNLYLGTAKQMINIWRDSKLISDKDFLTMQELANRVVVSSGYARITKKIGDGFSFMKADEWKSWCIIYFPFVLKHIISAVNLANWILFVKAYCLLTKPFITVKETAEAYKYLQEFCIKCQTSYKKPAITPNMHLHLHLSKCINNFGPVYVFWLFSFECYNGLLKKFETNRKGGFESIMIKQFLEKAYIGSYIRAFSTSFDKFIITFLHRISNSHTGKTALINNVASHNVVCRCAQCSRNSQGYSLVTSRTTEHHIRKDELERIERLDTA